MPHFVFFKCPLVQQTAKLHDPQASTWCVTDCKSSEEAVPCLKLLQLETPTVSLRGVCHSIVVLVVVVVLEHPPEHMVGCLHQQPLEVFSLPARCAPVGLENRHQQPAVHLTALQKKCILSQQPVNQYESRMIEFDGLLPLIIFSTELR